MWGSDCHLPQCGRSRRLGSRVPGLAADKIELNGLDLTSPPDTFAEHLLLPGMSKACSLQARFPSSSLWLHWGYRPTTSHLVSQQPP
jgi:hypothetical protein